MTRSGSEAQRGDTVRNLTTDRLGVVTGYSQFGRIYVELHNPDGTATWERWNVEVVRDGRTGEWLR